MVHISQTWSVV